MSKNKDSKKRDVLLELFEICQDRDDFVFDNGLVKKIAAKHKFVNPFDVTKVDTREVLPDVVRDAGYCVAHLGKGQHQFIPALRYWYHDFEDMTELDNVAWPYKPSLLDHADNSESNIISTTYNQRILHQFLYDTITADPKFYASRRTKMTTSYKVGDLEIQTKNLQMEMDATLERDGVVTVLESKNDARKSARFPTNFSIYQLFHPTLYYHQKVADIDELQCCFLIQKQMKRRFIYDYPTELTGRQLHQPQPLEEFQNEIIRVIRFYLYTFSNRNDLSTIRLLKKKQYFFQPI